MNRRTLLTASAGLGLTGPDALAAAAAANDAAATPAGLTAGYAEVNGLRMYYEVHGAGEPLLLLHGAYMNIDLAFAAYLPVLAATRRVIAVEVQGHGRTADRDMPLRYATLAGDVVALLDQLGIAQADVLGYSLGASIGLQLAIAHPSRVRKLIALSTAFARSGIHPELVALFEKMSPEIFLETPIYTEYVRLAPNPEDFSRLVEKVTDLDLRGPDFTPEQVAAVTAPTLLVVGDSDATTLSHAVARFALLGGGVAGDFQPLPASQLGVIPGATHVTVLTRTDQILPMVRDFLAAGPSPARAE